MNRREDLLFRAAGRGPALPTRAALDAAVLDRRRFLRLLGLGAAGVGLAACERGGGGGGSAPPLPSPLEAASNVVVASNDRVLLVIELGGGNDGLSTLAPVGLGRYHDLRPELALGDADVVALDGGYGLHKGLAPAKERLALLQGVGVGSPDLSHFTMMSRWWRGDPEGDAAYDTGFLGRCCDLIAADEPVTGLSLGFGASAALVAQRATTLSLPNLDLITGFADADADANPAGQALRDGWNRMAEEGAGPADAPPGGGAAASPGGGAARSAGLLQVARGGLGAALQFVDVIAAMPPASAGYPETDLGRQLALASRLIRGNAGVRVFHVPFGSFDTHDDQRGAHDGFMNEIGLALAAFYHDLDTAGHGGRVLTATTSEFGRRVPAERGGTDHGGASVALLAGPVTAGRLGEEPSLDALDENDNLVATTNLRDYYATLAEGWLGIPAGEVLPAGATPLGGIVVT